MSVSCSESGAWQQALPLSSISLRMDNDVLRISVSLHLSIAMCHPHACSSCGVQVTSLRTHRLSYRFSKGHHSTHAAINDILKRALDSAKIPSHLEPSGLYRSGGKCPKWGFCGAMEAGQDIGMRCYMCKCFSPLLIEHLQPESLKQ